MQFRDKKKEQLIKRIETSYTFNRQKSKNNQGAQEQEQGKRSGSN